MGQKEQEYMRRLHEEGVHIDEVPKLLGEIERERALERAPKENPRQFDDPKVQRLSDLWFSQRTTATVEQKDKVGLAYISHVLGLGEEAAIKFAQGDRKAYHAVGMKQSGIPPIDTFLFWEEVHRIFPNAYTIENIEFLSQQGGIMATLHFLWQLEVPLAEESPVLRSLAINAHTYK